MDTKDTQTAIIPELQWIEKLTYMMDSLIRLPLTNFRFGLDPIIGLVPLVGDVVSFAISGLMLLSMVRHGVSGRLLVLMIGNLIFDFLLGEITTVGDVADFGLKANSRNLKLLKRHLEKGELQGNGWGTVLMVALILLVIQVALVVGVWFLLAWVWNSLSAAFAV
ncbi:MAG: DUF4112 domain-containing protein [Bacteroidetes bacterium]|nr:MAG: DUF4112 domain-containing protein [Bacteroidota bacterium]